MNNKNEQALAEDQLVIELPDGTEELATILFTHEANDKNYVVFEYNESKEVSAAQFIPSADGSGELADIETDEELDMLNDLLDAYYDELDEEEETDDDL